MIPLHYKIEIEPLLERETFDGTVTITANVLRPTKVITLHAKNLYFDSASVEDFETSLWLDFSHDFLHVHTIHDVIQPGNITVKINYQGELKTNGYYGLYAESYQNTSTGEEE